MYRNWKGSVRQEVVKRFKRVSEMDVMNSGGGVENVRFNRC
jgi:hypothetical protein